jgi:hypothetical protein
MVQPQVTRPTDVRDPNFGRDMCLWAFQTQCEPHELVVVSRETIAATRVMIAQADHILKLLYRFKR